MNQEMTTIASKSFLEQESFLPAKISAVATQALLITGVHVCEHACTRTWAQFTLKWLDACTFKSLAEWSACHNCTVAMHRRESNIRVDGDAWRGLSVANLGPSLMMTRFEYNFIITPTPLQSGEECRAPLFFAMPSAFFVLGEVEEGPVKDIWW